MEPRFTFELCRPCPFSEGLSPVILGNGWSSEESVERMAYIDRHGEIVIPGPFQGAGPFSQGLAPIVTGGKLPFCGTR